MNAHEQFAEDLVLYALVSLEEEQLTTLEDHLNGCAACRSELELLWGDIALIALSTVGPTPSRQARERLLAAIAREPRSERSKSQLLGRPVWGWVASPALIAAIILAVFTGVVIHKNVALQRDHEALNRRIVSQQTEVERARELLAIVMAPDTMRVTLVATRAKPQPQGKALYLRDRGALLFIASNLAPVPKRKTYELWLLPKTGPPIPAGTFRPDTHGNAMVVEPPLPKGTEAKTFAVTVETEGGSSIPTMPIIMMGRGS